jgi:Zn-dependent alcohol dehydrogenase
MREKALLGCLYGSTRPLVDMPRIVDLYVAGWLKIDEVARSIIKF